jgi:hypothetical protein
MNDAANNVPAITTYSTIACPERDLMAEQNRAAFMIGLINMYNDTSGSFIVCKYTIS